MHYATFMKINESAGHISNRTHPVSRMSSQERHEVSAVQTLREERRSSCHIDTTQRLYHMRMRKARENSILAAYEFVSANARL
jgi:hypothetical protein